MFLNGCKTPRRNGSLTPWNELGRVWGSTAQSSFRMFLKIFIPSRRKKFSTPWNALDRVWGSTTIRSFERCWKSAQQQNERILQRRKMSWTVTKDVGERGPAMNLIVFKWLHNIQTKRFFNTVNNFGLCLGKHGPAISSNSFEKLHTIQTKRFFHTVKWGGPCLGKHDQPFIWTLAKVRITSKRNDFSTPQNELGRDIRCWRTRRSINLIVFAWLQNIQTKKVFNTVKRTEPCLGELDTAVSSNVFETLLTIQTKKSSNTVKWAGPCLEEHEHLVI